MRLPLDPWSKTAVEDYKRFSLQNCPLKVITMKSVWDGDVKTALVKKKPEIPKGTVLEVKEFFFNLEGDFARCEYEGFSYSIDVKEIKMV